MEWLIGLVIKLIPPAGNWLGRKLRKPDPQNVLEHRKKLATEAQQNLRKPDRYGTRGDAIIHDINRLNEYRPHDLGPQRTSNAWFKVEIMGMYPAGLAVIYGSVRRVQFDDRSQSWMPADPAGEITGNDIVARHACEPIPEVITVFPVGELPYDRIVRIEWEGDDYYRCPHIYCQYVGRRRTPFDTTMYYVHDPDMPEEYPWVQVPGDLSPRKRSVLRRREADRVS